MHDVSLVALIRFSANRTNSPEPSRISSPLAAVSLTKCLTRSDGFSNVAYGFPLPSEKLLFVFFTIFTNDVVCLRESKLFQRMTICVCVFFSLNSELFEPELRKLTTATANATNRISERSHWVLVCMKRTVIRQSSRLTTPLCAVNVFICIWRVCKVC